MTQIGKRIKERRLDVGISADELAEKIGVSRATMFRYENGDIDGINVKKLIPIAKALRTTPTYLMGLDDTKELTTKQLIIELVEQMPDDLDDLVLRIIRAILAEGGAK